MRHFLLITYALILCICLGQRTKCKADDSPGFFLKITKNVPRLGRRSDKEFEGSFLNSYKNIPRIGRSVETNFKSLLSWLSSHPVKSPDKRMLINPLTRIVTEQELSVVQPVNSNTLMELLDKDAISGDDVKFVHWKDFDRALQIDGDLYSKVYSLGRKPDQRLKQDITMSSSFIPMLGNALNPEDPDYMLYNHAGGWDIPYASDFMRYNRIL